LKSKINLSSGATQPLLCCLGENVAGSSTQFLMERAIEATEIDWRAITVEVAANELGNALTGMSAMKFTAARFFPSLQSPAAGLLGVNSPQLQFLGAVTSASRTPTGWQAWHHWGPALLQWTRQSYASPPALCWLHGDSVRCRSVLIALHELAHINSTALPQAVLWSDPPRSLTTGQLPTELLSIAGEERILPIELFADTRAETALFTQRLTQLTVESAQFTTLIVGEEFPTQLHNLEGSALACVCAGGSEFIKQAKKLKPEPACVLSEVEQSIACEAYDFQRWTGQPINPALLRDAYDEYCDF